MSYLILPHPDANFVMKQCLRVTHQPHCLSCIDRDPSTAEDGPSAPFHPSSPLSPEAARKQLLAVGEEVDQREWKRYPPGPHTRLPSAENQVSLNRRTFYWLGDKYFYLDRTRLIFQLGKNSFFLAQLFIRLFKHTGKLKE